MNKCYGIIYRVTNKINGKMYIGQTVKSLSKRIHSHINIALSGGDNIYFHKAIKKYGKENFTWSTIAECNSLEELNIAEIEMIKKYNTFSNGYNLTKGGEGNVGFRHKEETKRKIGNANKGKSRHKGKKHPMYGKYHTEESKEKMSRSHKGKKLLEETKKKISKSNRDKVHLKKYMITTPEDEKIFVNGLAGFCRRYKEEKLNDGHLIEVAQGKYKKHKGYKCEYWEEISNEV